jgi:hAT family C-terminal dimerisation region
MFHPFVLCGFPFCRENTEWEPEQYWPEHKALFPRMEQLARHFLCILPSSAASERVWSAMKHFLTDESSHMDAETAIQLMFLNQHQKEFQQHVRSSTLADAGDEDLDKRDAEIDAHSDE